MNFKEYLNRLNDLHESKSFVDLYNVNTLDSKTFAKFSSKIKNPNKISSEILKMVRSLEFENEFELEDNVIALEAGISDLLLPHFVVKNGKLSKRSKFMITFDVYVSKVPAGDYWDANTFTGYKIRIGFK